MSTKMDEHYLAAYEGSDMIGFMLAQGFSLSERAGRIITMANYRDTAIIVTEFAVWRARPDSGSGFSIELLTWL